MTELEELQQKYDAVVTSRQRIATKLKRMKKALFNPASEIPEPSDYLFVLLEDREGDRVIEKAWYNEDWHFALGPLERGENVVGWLELAPPEGEVK